MLFVLILGLNYYLDNKEGFILNVLNLYFCCVNILIRFSDDSSLYSINFRSILLNY